MFNLILYSLFIYIVLSFEITKLAVMFSIVLISLIFFFKVVFFFLYTYTLLLVCIVHRAVVLFFEMVNYRLPKLHSIFFNTTVLVILFLFAACIDFFRLIRYTLLSSIRFYWFMRSALVEQTMLVYEQLTIDYALFVKHLYTISKRNRRLLTNITSFFSNLPNCIFSKISSFFTNASQYLIRTPVVSYTKSAYWKCYSIFMNLEHSSYKDLIWLLFVTVSFFLIDCGYYGYMCIFTLVYFYIRPLFILLCITNDIWFSYDVIKRFLLLVVLYMCKCFNIFDGTIIVIVTYFYFWPAIIYLYMLYLSFLNAKNTYLYKAKCVFSNIVTFVLKYSTYLTPVFTNLVLHLKNLVVLYTNIEDYISSSATSLIPKIKLNFVTSNDLSDNNISGFFYRISYALEYCFNEIVDLPKHVDDFLTAKFCYMVSEFIRLAPITFKKHYPACKKKFIYCLFYTIDFTILAVLYYVYAPYYFFMLPTYTYVIAPILGDIPKDAFYAIKRFFFKYLYFINVYCRVDVWPRYLYNRTYVFFKSAFFGLKSNFGINQLNTCHKKTSLLPSVGKRKINSKSFNLIYYIIKFSLPYIDTVFFILEKILFFTVKVIKLLNWTLFTLIALRIITPLHKTSLFVSSGCRFYTNRVRLPIFRFIYFFNKIKLNYVVKPILSTKVGSYLYDLLIKSKL